MKHFVNTKWDGGMQFKSDVPPNNTIDLDTSIDGGGKGEGVGPKALMLTSLTGCTGMDIASLLKKMRAEVRHFEISAEASLTEEHPKYYDKVHMVYTFYGVKFKKDKIEKSIHLSIDRYCGVYKMFKQFAEMTHEIVYIDES